jgi:hypothetical protein
MKPMRSGSRARAGALAAVAGACLASCGARTPLDVGLFLGSGADAAAPVTPCVPGTIALTKAAPVLLFVLDRSGSMAEPLGGASGESKWQVLTDGLASTLPSVDSSMEIGALVFPTTAGGGRGGFSTASCTVSGGADLAPATGNVGALVSLLAGTVPAGSTPTASAIQAAATVLLSTRAATTARALVLATDGAPNCNGSLDPSTCTCAGTGPNFGGQGCGGSGAMCLDDVRTVSTIASYESQGLPTYVIGLESTNDAVFSQVLGEMAVAGGRPYGGSTTYYAARSATDLNAALVAIRDQVGACTFLTTSVPNTGGTITLSLDGAKVPYDPSGIDGWAWGDMANGQIVLFGATCTLAAGGANVTTLSADVACAPDGGLEGGASPADAGSQD